MRQQPTQSQFYLLRFGKTTLRALHVLGLCGAAGGFYFALPIEMWRNWWILAMASGTALLLWEVWRSRLYLIQMKGVLTLVKLALLALCVPLPQWKAELFSIIVLMSVITAHGPSQLRHYSIWHRRELRGKEIKG